MTVEEPRPSRFDLRFRLLGVPIRIHPLFWLSSAAFGLPFVADPEHGSAALFALWLVVVFVSLLMHEFGHVCVGRLFGLRGSIVLSILGGFTTGIDSLPRLRQRVLVLLAGPFVHAVIFGAWWGLTETTWPAVFQGARPGAITGTVLAMVALVNFFWGLFNLLPLWPLDGGRIICDIGESLFGRRGRTGALVLCLATCGLLAVGMILQLSLWLKYHRYEPAYAVGIEWFALLVLFCFLLWLRTFRALWPEESLK
jgi:stage IV sporulation protein FB